MMDARAVLNGETDLHKAARQGDTAKLKALLLAGADVHCKDPHGYFRLHHVHFVDRAGLGWAWPSGSAASHGHWVAGLGLASAGGCHVAQ